ncbi:tail fiber protein [Marinilabiliaceae bacterium JC040]|nr:tail fiber protein [Marinilabiliaceae bacterium JC040]
MRRILVFILVICFFSNSYSQSVGIGTTDFTPDESAALEIRSNSKGLLIPRMLLSERNAISSPGRGLLIYQTDQQSGFYYFDGNKWEILGTNLNDKDIDPKNEIQVLSIKDDIIYLSKGGGFVKLPAGTIGAQTLSINGTILSIANGNSVDLSSVKDNLGNHKAEKNIILFSHYISGDGDDEGISINSNGDVVFSNVVSVKGEINLKAGSINTSELEDGSVTEPKLGINSVSSNKLQSNSVIREKIADSAVGTRQIENSSIISTKLVDGSVTSSKIGNGQVLGNKISSMNASTDSYLKWNGKVWGPSSIGGALNYLGVWSAQENKPVLVDGTGFKGDFYIVSTFGDQDLGSGIIKFYSGDWILYNGTKWERVNNSSEVNSVFGRKGVITAHKDDYTWAQIDKTQSSLSDISEVITSSPDRGRLLVGNGTHWESLDIYGDINIDSHGKTTIGSKKVTYSKIQDALGEKGSLIIWSGINWEETNIDLLISKKLQDIYLNSSNILGLTKSNVSVDLSKYLDNTDSQDLSLVGNELKLTNDLSSVDLSKYLDDTDNQTLSLNGSILSIRDGNTVDFKDLADSFMQDLSLTGNTLSLTSDSSPVDLTKYLDNTDSQVLNLNSKDELKISNSNSTISLSKYLDNTDNQYLEITDHKLSISGGNTIDLSVADIQDLSLSNDILSITNDSSPVDLSQYRQTLSVNANTISISGGNSIDIAILDTDDQRLNLIGTKLSIENGNNVDLSPIQDNLGNHKAIKNLQLGAHWLSYDGTSKGIYIQSSGDVNVNKKLNVYGDIFANSNMQLTENLSIGGTKEASSLLTITSTSKGILISRMTKDQRDNIIKPARGLMIYNTSTNTFNYFNGTNWEEVGGDDNMGNHIASLNIQLRNKSISNDGDTEGISLNDNGNVIMSNELFIKEGLYVGGIGGINSSAILGLESVNQGFLPPRMTSQQRESISSPAKGLMVFDTTINTLYIYNGIRWVSAEAKENTWNLGGNSAVNESTDYIGTSNAADLVLKSQNSEVMRLSKDGRVGVGTNGKVLESSAKVQIDSRNKGFLPPRMTSSERNSIQNPAIGLIVYDTDKKNLYLYTGAWTEIGVPIGSVQAYTGIQIPDGWKSCDGSSFNASEYPELKVVLGSTKLPNIEKDIKDETGSTVLKYIIRVR